MPKLRQSTSGSEFQKQKAKTLVSALWGKEKTQEVLKDPKKKEAFKTVVTKDFGSSFDNDKSTMGTMEFSQSVDKASGGTTGVQQQKAPIKSANAIQTGAPVMPGRDIPKAEPVQVQDKVQITGTTKPSTPITGAPISLDEEQITEVNTVLQGAGVDTEGKDTQTLIDENRKLLEGNLSEATRQQISATFQQEGKKAQRFKSEIEQAQADITDDYERQKKIRSIQQAEEYDQMKKGLDDLRQNTGFLTGTAGWAQSDQAVGAAKNQLDMAQTTFDRIMEIRELSNQGFDRQFENKMRDLNSQLNFNLEQTQVQALNDISTVEAQIASGSLTPDEGLEKIQGLMEVAGTKNIDLINNNVAMRELELNNYNQMIDEYQARITPDLAITEQMQDGFLYNAQGQKVMNNNGQPLQYDQSKKVVDRIQNKDGSMTMLYEDGTFDNINFGLAEEATPGITGRDRYMTVGDKIFDTTRRQFVNESQMREEMGDKLLPSGGFKEGQEVVIGKGQANPYLGKTGGSLTWRTNNPLAISPATIEDARRLEEVYGAIPGLYSNDAFDKFVLNFNSIEDGIAAGALLLENKAGMTLNELAESHTGTAAQSHKKFMREHGLDMNRTYGSLNMDEKSKVIDSIMRAEGFTEGVTSQPTQTITQDTFIEETPQYEELSTNAKAVWDGDISLGDFTASEMSAINSELKEAGYYEQPGKGNAKFAKLPTKDRDALSNLLLISDKISKIRELKEKVNTWPIKGRITGESLPFYGWDQDQIELEILTGTNLAEFMNKISGAAVSEQEVARLSKLVPNVKQNDRRFNLSLDQMEQENEKLINAKIKEYGFDSLEEIKSATGFDSISSSDPLGVN